MRVLSTGFFDTDNVANLHLKRRDVYLAIVDHDVAMVDELPGLPARGRETCAVSRIVQAPLKQEQQVFTRDSLHAGSAFKIVSELSFKNEIDAFDLLLLAQLLALTDQRLAAAH